MIRRMSLLSVALAFGVALPLLSPGVVRAQCLSDSECDALRAELQTHRDASSAERAEIRELKERARTLARGSEERAELRAEIRELRRELRSGRNSDVRELRRQYRDGCRRC